MAEPSPKKVAHGADRAGGKRMDNALESVGSGGMGWLMIFPLFSFGASLSNLESPGNKAPPWGGEKGKKKAGAGGGECVSTSLRTN